MDKNWCRFLFTFPHPSSNGMSVWVNFPWALIATQVLLMCMRKCTQFEVRLASTTMQIRRQVGTTAKD
jgi:hypothetical protein